MSLLLLTPTVIEFAHALSNHEHKVCTSTENQHIHEKEVDCVFSHLQLKIVTIIPVEQTEAFIEPNYSSIVLQTSKRIKSLRVSKKSSRAPPVFIV